MCPKNEQDDQPIIPIILYQTSFADPRERSELTWLVADGEADNVRFLPPGVLKGTGHKRLVATEPIDALSFKIRVTTHPRVVDNDFALWICDGTGGPLMANPNWGWEENMFDRRTDWPDVPGSVTEYFAAQEGLELPLRYVTKRIKMGNVCYIILFKASPLKAGSATSAPPLAPTHPPAHHPPTHPPPTPLFLIGLAANGGLGDLAPCVVAIDEGTGGYGARVPAITVEIEVHPDHMIFTDSLGCETRTVPNGAKSYASSYRVYAKDEPEGPAGFGTCNAYCADAGYCCSTSESMTQ
ncbi:hypothetical protein T492DRAFT_1146882, partial [Pavlovales sp. CCMP2436]